MARVNCQYLFYYWNRAASVSSDIWNSTQ